MNDKNDIIYILGKLDIINKNLIKTSKEFMVEFEKLKTFFPFSDISNEKKYSKSIPEKFFYDFLKPLLETNKKMTKKEILKMADKQNKYNSQNTLNQYLPKLECEGYINSIIEKREKLYMLKFPSQ